jgi:hypothetical protein
MTWYAALQTYSRGRMTYMAHERHVHIMELRRGSAEGRTGANATVDAAMEELRSYERTVRAFHGRLARAMGLGDTGASERSTAAEPSLRGATGDPALQEL